MRLPLPPPLPPLCSSSSSSLPLLSLPLSPLPFLRPRRFRPLSSLRETKKQPTRQKASKDFRFDNRKRAGDEGKAPEGDAGGDAVKGTVLAVLLLVGVVGGFGAAGYVYKDQINAFLTQFSGFIEGISASDSGSSSLPLEIIPISFASTDGAGPLDDLSNLM